MFLPGLPRSDAAAADTIPTPHTVCQQGALTTTAPYASLALLTPSLTPAQVFNGTLTKYTFPSPVLGNLDANLNIFLPPTASATSPAPVLYYLSGLTCTEDNAAQKGNFFEAAAQEGIALVFPDTSPRGAKIEGEDDAYDFGSGAGFYVDASREPWSKHYKVSRRVRT